MKSSRPGPVGERGLERHEPRFLVVRSGERSFPAKSAPGIQVVERTTHSIETIPFDLARVDGSFDLTLFTSRAAVARFFADGRLASKLSGEVVAVGPATAAELRNRGRTDVQVAGGSAAGILERLAPRLAGVRVLLPRGEDASDELPRELALRGAEVVSLPLYRKTRLPYDPALDAEIIGRPFDVVLATSPSAVRWLFEGADADAREVLRRTPSVALGPATRRAFEKRGVDAIAIAEPPSFEAAARIAASLAGHHRAK